MNIKDLLSNPYHRISMTHLLVIAVLLLNIFFFVEHTIAVVIQVIVIIAVWLHHKDDMAIKRKLDKREEQLIAEKDIFDRNVIVSESDINGVITYVNPKFCEISGYTSDELLGQKHSIIRDPQAPKEFFEKLWKTIKSGNTFNAEFKNIKKDGTPYWVDSAISPIVVNSEIVGYKAIRFDITDKVVAKKYLQNEIDLKETQLKTQANRFEFAINSSRDGFWDYDLINKEFYLSSGWKTKLGFKKEDNLTYLDYLSLIPDEHRFEHHKAMHDAIEEYPNELEYVHFRIRYPLVTKAGEKLLIEDVGDAFFDDKHALTRITGFHRDITEQERQNKIIESQNRIAAMGEMIGNIAHQWRQPISAINNTLNDIEIDIELEDKGEIDSKDFLQISNKIKDYTKYLSQTIDDFRNISSDEKAKSDFFIKSVLDEAYNIVQKSFESRNIKFQVIESGEHSYVYNGYKRELIQVIINILNNAKDIIIEKNIQEPFVLVTIKETQEKSLIIIHDNAGGVPASIQDKIFDPYFTTKHESVGTGIGLYMSKKMVIDHFCGSIDVENEDNGAKFTITLPRECN